MPHLEEQIKKFMNLVYDEVELAIKEGNPPFGALIIDKSGSIVALTHNQSNTKRIAIAHAEIEAIQIACSKLNQKKLEDCTIFVNAESCAMCSGAIIKSGIRKVFYGAPYEVGSSPDIYLREINEKAHPQLEIVSGIIQEKFMEQIKRGRKMSGKSAKFNI